MNSLLLRFQFPREWLKPQCLPMSDFRFFFTFGPLIFPLHSLELCSALKLCLLFFIQFFLGVFSGRTFIIYYLPYSQKQKHWIFAVPPGLVIWFIKAPPLESSGSRGEFTVSTYVHFLRNSKELENSEKKSIRSK